MALNMSPGRYRSGFGFQKLQTFQLDAWQRAQAAAKAAEKTELQFPIIGFDVDPRMIEMAKANVTSAGLEKYITIHQRAIKDLTKPVEGEGVIVCNPPYGDRLKAKNKIEELYKDFGDTLKHQFKGYEAWILSGNKELTPCLRLKAEKSYGVDNNSIDCKWLKYNLF